MNAKAPKCSVLTLAETAGLRRSIDEKLSGQRGAFWLSALKRLDRKENPWIPFEKVLEVKDYPDPADGMGSYLARLRLCDIDVYEVFKRHFENVDIFSIDPTQSFENKFVV